MQWTGERLGLLAIGFRLVIWVHVSCIDHGMFRLGIPEEQERYPCPQCQKPCKAAVVATGYTRLEVPTEPKLIVKGLSMKARAWLAVEEPKRVLRVRRRPKDYHHGQKIRRLTAANGLKSALTTGSCESAIPGA